MGSSVSSTGGGVVTPEGTTESTEADTTGEDDTSTGTTAAGTSDETSTTAAPYCGDGVLDEGEECEPAASSDCQDDCTWPRNVAFISSVEFTPGSLGGLAGADAQCQALADDAGLAGTYVAWLSDSTTDAVDRLADARGWRRPDGLPFADDVDDIVAGRVWYPLLVDETGTANAQPRFVLTATNPVGTLHGPSTCDDWDYYNPLAPPEFVAVGRSDHNAGFWTSGGAGNCQGSYALYCFGIDHAHAVTLDVPDDARYAFVSSGGLPPQSGLEGADDLCDADAADAGLPGTYLALLAPDGASAMSRFSTDDGPWVLPSGVSLAETAADFADDTRLSPISQTADATPLELVFTIWSGASTTATAGTMDNSCEEWTVTTGFGLGTVSWVGVLADPWFGDLYPACDDEAVRVFCLQE